MFYMRFLTMVFLIGFFIFVPLYSDDTIPPDSIQIDAKPIPAFSRDDTERVQFSDLEFRGGLELSSSDPRFGGISALHIQPDGQYFLALTDRAYWLRGRIAYEGTRPVAITGAEMAPVIGPGEKHAAQWDTESIAGYGERLYIGVEDMDQIPSYNFVPRQFPVYREALSFPPGRNLPRNRGLEALVLIPKENQPDGRLIAFSEKGLDKNGNLTAYIIEDGDISEFAVRRFDGYDISDAVLLPEGDVLVLERKFEVLSGVSIRLRRIAVSSIRPNALVDGPVVVEADMHYHVDNMEAISVHRDAEGVTVLTIMSDDNFSTMQKTLLCQFAYRK